MPEKFIIGENVTIRDGNQIIRCVVRAFREDGLITLIERFPRVHIVDQGAITRDDEVHHWELGRLL